MFRFEYQMFYGRSVIAAENLNHIKRKTKKKSNNEKLNRISYAVLRVPPVIKYKPKGE